MQLMSSNLFGALTLVMASFGFSIASFGQGSLTPPGPPAPSMKTLDQVEPRVPIGPAQIFITQAGSYYVTANRAETATNQAFIYILTNDVTLDLKGFTLRGGLYAQSGIYIPAGLSNIVVRNGAIENFLSGGISAASTVRCRFSDVAVLNCGNGGVQLGTDSLLSGCNVVSNSLFGILASNGAVIRDCLVVSNAGNGINVGNNAIVERCQARGNNGLGITTGDLGVVRDCQVANSPSIGIQVGETGTIESCQVRSNGNSGILIGSSFQIRNSVVQGNSSFGCQTGASGGIENCIVVQNSGTGIYAQDYVRVLNCTAVSNAFNGIVVWHGSLVSGCVAAQNAGTGIYVLYPGCNILNNDCYGNNPAAGLFSAGIYVDDNNNRIDGNHVTANGNAGIYVNGSYNNNVVVRNTVSGNGANNYVVPTPANDLGPVGTAATATSPWANISH